MTVSVRRATTADDWTAVRALVEEYVRALGFPLTFQDVARELADLDREYGPPSGVALLAGLDAEPEPVGVVGVRRFADGVGEVKRMYVRPQARGRGVGRALATAAVDAARELGYRTLRLDTTAAMTTAIAIYRASGFRPIPAYRHNPRPDARFFELELFR